MRTIRFAAKDSAELFLKYIFSFGTFARKSLLHRIELWTRRG
ncbi:hypothetical protein RND81_07G032300 [Saponaria officinalis]|uniref:Uncharacterized protein n=1 Tax=Saponaria officinalis TaxID=3572 RepID=A0AAW1JK49_SAPOF